MNDAPENMSRREFLRTIMAGGAFLAELSLSAPARAALEELFASQEYKNEDLESLLARLREEVYENPNEVMWVYVERGGKSYAVNLLKSATDRSATGVDLAPLYEDREVTKAHLLHTHPATLFLADPAFPKEKADQILREKRSDYPRIPSHADILECMASKVEMEDRGQKGDTKHYLVEPSGTWSYEVDMSHPAISAALSVGGNYDSRAEMIKGSSALGMVLGNDLQEWSKKLQAGDGMSTELLAEFQSWAKETYGITFAYRKATS